MQFITGDREPGDPEGKTGRNPGGEKRRKKRRTGRAVEKSDENDGMVAEEVDGGPEDIVRGRRKIEKASGGGTGERSEGGSAEEEI